MMNETDCPSVVAEATRLRGDITFNSEAHIHGIVEGDLTQQSNQLLHVGRTGWVHGSIKSCGQVVIEGRVDGHVQAAHTILLLPTATIRGQLVAPKVQITAGAVIEGEVKMGHRHPSPAVQEAA